MTLLGVDIHIWIIVLGLTLNATAYILVAISTRHILKRTKEITSFQDDFLRFQNELQAMHKKVMDENDDFFIILEGFDKQFESLIKRQGKIGGIIGTVIKEARKHDRKVSHILKMLGETVPDDDESDHLPDSRLPLP